MVTFRQAAPLVNAPNITQSGRCFFLNAQCAVYAAYDPADLAECFLGRELAGLRRFRGDFGSDQKRFISLGGFLLVGLEREVLEGQRGMHLKSLNCWKDLSVLVLHVFWFFDLCRLCKSKSTVILVIA